MKFCAMCIRPYRELTAAFFGYPQHMQIAMVVYFGQEQAALAIHKLLHTWGASVNNVNISSNGDGEEGFSNSVTAVLELNMKSYADGNTILVDLLKENCVLYADFTTKTQTSGDDQESI